MPGLETNARPWPNRVPRAPWQRAFAAGGDAVPEATERARAQALARDAGQEAARHRVVTLVLLVYLLVIVEGALRKWVLPQYSQYLFFLRDPVLLLIYAIATRHGLWPRGSLFLRLAWAWAVLGMLLFVVQAAAGGSSEHRLLLGVYGWRAYFLYMPLAFLVGAVFRREDLLRLFRWTLLLAVPIAVLVTLQFFSAPGAPINVGTAAEEEQQFRGLGLNAERTRPMGPFASGAGQQQFVATACAVVLAFFIAPRGVAQPALALLALASGAVLTCIALSGSRGTVLQCALALLFALLVGVFGRGGAVKSRAWIWPMVLGVAAVALYPLLFPEGFSAFSQRWEVADAAESRSFEFGVFGRAMYGLVDFLRLVDQVPFFGYGLGYGGNAAITLGVSVDGINPGKLAETDFSRHMVDLGPLVGLLYIAFRLSLTGWLIALAMRATRRSPDPMPMLLLSYVAYVLVLGQITGQGAINAYGWLFAGLLIAACRAAAAPAPSPTRGTGPTARQRTTFSYRTSR